MLAFPTDEQNLGIGKDLQVVRDRRLCEIEPLADLTARQLARRGDLLDHPEAALVRQCLEYTHEFLVVHVRLP